MSVEPASTATQESADAAFEDTTVTEAPESTEAGAAETATTSSPASDATAEAAGVAARETPAAEATEAPPESATASDQTAEETPDLSDFDPFVFKAEGAEHQFPGAVMDAEGQVFFPKTAVPILKQQLAAARAYPRLQRESARRDHESAQRLSAAEQERNTVLETLDRLFSDPNAAAEFLAKGAENWKVLRAEARSRALESQTKADRARLDEIEAEQQEAASRPLYEEAIDEALAFWGPQAGLSPQDLTELRAYYVSNFDRVFPRATEDDPATGRQKGKRYDDRTGWMKQDLERVMKWRGAQAVRTTKAPAEAAKAENAKRTGPTKAPPAVAAGKGATAPTKGRPSYKSTREADDAIWG